MRSLFAVVVVVLFSCSPPVMTPVDSGEPDTTPHEGRSCAPVGGLACDSPAKVLVCESRPLNIVPDAFVGYECSRCTSDGGYVFCDFSAVPAGVKCPAFAEGVAHCGLANEQIRCSSGEFRSLHCDGGCVSTTVDGGAGSLCRP